MRALLAKIMCGNYNSSLLRQHTVYQSIFRYVCTQVRLSGESLRILWPSCRLKLAGIALNPAKAIFVIKYKLLAGVFSTRTVLNSYMKILLYLSNKFTICINNICFLKHSYMFRCLYIILRYSLIMYAKVTE